MARSTDRSSFRAGDFARRADTAEISRKAGLARRRTTSHIMVLVAEYVLKGGTFGENVVLIVECLHMGAGGMEVNARDAGKTSTGVPATATALGVARHDFLQHLAPQAMDWISFLRIALPSHDRTRNRSALRSSKHTC